MLDHRNVYQQRRATPPTSRPHGHRNVYTSQASPRSFTRPTGVGFQTPVASLLWLSHDEVGILAAELSCPLVPGPAVNVSLTCHELRAPLSGPLATLKEQHERAKELCVQVDMSCAQVRAAEELVWYGGGLTTAHCKTLGMYAALERHPSTCRSTFCSA